MKELAVLCCNPTLRGSPRNPFFLWELSLGQVRVRQLPCFHLKLVVHLGPTHNLQRERSALLKARSQHLGWARTTDHPNQKHSLEKKFWVQVGYGWDIPNKWLGIKNWFYMWSQLLLPWKRQSHHTFHWPHDCVWPTCDTCAFIYILRFLAPLYKIIS